MDLNAIRLHLAAGRPVLLTPPETDLSRMGTCLVLAADAATEAGARLLQTWGAPGLALAVPASATGPLPVPPVPAHPVPCAGSPSLYPSASELALALVRLAGREPAALLAPFRTSEGRSLPAAQAGAMGRTLRLPVLSGDAVLQAWLTAVCPLAEAGGALREATPYGEMQRRDFSDTQSGALYTALVRGDVDGPAPVSVRVHPVPAGCTDRRRDQQELLRLLRRTAAARRAVCVRVEPPPDRPLPPERQAASLAWVVRSLGVRQALWMGPAAVAPWLTAAGIKALNPRQADLRPVWLTAPQHTQGRLKYEQG